jgi:dynein heavy chain
MSNINYTFRDWRNDLKSFLIYCGLDQRNTTLLISESQLVMEQQMEDLNTLLTSIDLPVIYSEKDMDDICEACKVDCIRDGLDISRINLYNKFIDRLKSCFHLVILMSPQHKDYSQRIRSFPSLLSSCIFDWFHGWPEEALLRVSRI